MAIVIDEETPYHIVLIAQAVSVSPVGDEQQAGILRSHPWQERRSSPRPIAAFRPRLQLELRGRVTVFIGFDRDNIQVQVDIDSRR